MQKILITLSTLLLLSTSGMSQSAEDIISKYLEAAGGIEKMSSITSMKMMSTVQAQGMEMPAEMVRKAPNKMKMTLSFQGYEIVQPAFNGEQGWSTNFISMENEMMQPEAAAAIKSEAQDFPDVFFNYKEKGYTLSKEEDEGNFFVIKLTKAPIVLEGEEIANEATYYFDKTTSLLMSKKATAEAGPTKGMEMETIYADYKEVDGLMFPFTIDQKINGMTQASINVEAIELNLDVDDAEFEFPE